MRLSFSILSVMIVNTIVLSPVHGWSKHLGLGLGYTNMNNHIPVKYTLMPVGFSSPTTVQEDTNTMTKNAPHLSLSYSLAKQFGPYDLALESTFILQRLNAFKHTLNWQPVGVNGIINPALTTKTHGILSVSAAPAINIEPWFQFFARLGPALTVFHSSSKNGTLASGGLLGYSGSFNKLLMGINSGLGTRITLEPRWKLQLDYNHLYFIPFSKYGPEPGNTASGQNAYTLSRYHLNAHMLTLSSFYDF
jgi:hypothetical protein